MTELRLRDVGDRVQNEVKEAVFEDIDKEDTPRIPATSDGIENNPVLQNIPKKYRNYWIRFVVTWILIFSFAVVVYGGAIPLSILILAVQLICFNEIITIGYKVYKTYNLPWFRTLSWYFLFVYNYYLHGDFLADFFRYYLMKRILLNKIFSAFAQYHSFISYCFYLSAFVAFILSLRQGSYFSQFTMFGFTHLILLIIVTQSHMIVSNLFAGMVWFLLPVSCVITNDIMAYMFGFFLGRTKLIELSPKKTWEGFIGGAVSTVLFAIMIAHWLCGFDSMVCPVTFNETTHDISYECERHAVFIQTEVHVWAPLRLLLGGRDTITLYPFLGHALIISLFVSIVGPFGGFFASGFKRAFKVKDFGDVLPGHGGLMDRFDCQLLVGSFVYVYLRNFIRTHATHVNIHNFVLGLSDRDQLTLYAFLQDELLSKNLLCGFEVCGETKAG